MKDTPISKPRIAFIGLGNQGKQHFAVFSQLAQQKKVDIVGLCDIFPSDIKTSVPFFSDYHELLHHIKPDAVFIAVPNFLHKQIAIDALSHGCDVIKEKPLATSFVDGQELIAYANERKRLVITAQQRFHSPLFQQTKMILGRLGSVKGFNYTFTVHDETPSWYWHQKAGGGAWLNLGWHTISIVQWLMGEISDVQLSWNIGGKRNWIYDTDHSAYAKVQLENGATGLVFVSCIYSKEEKIEIQCERGIIRLDRNHLDVTTPEETTIYSSSAASSVKNPYLPQAQSFLDSLQSRNYDMQKDLRTLRVIQLGFDSVQKGKNDSYIQ